MEGYQGLAMIFSNDTKMQNCIGADEILRAKTPNVTFVIAAANDKAADGVMVDGNDCDIRGMDTSEAKDHDIQKTTREILTAKDLATKMDKMDMRVQNQLMESSQQNRMRIALGVIVRLVLPVFNGVARGWHGLRGIRLLKALRNLVASRHMLTNMLAYAANTISMGLSSVQAYRIDPILKIMKLKKGSAVNSIAESSESVGPTVCVPKRLLSEREEPEKCVTLNILAEPPAGTPIRADIIFIHGLHGSLPNTWKQGLWNSTGREVKFERPPRPPLRPPKRPRHSRSSRITPPHSHKRARYANIDACFAHESEFLENETTDETTDNAWKYKCKIPPEDTEVKCDGLETNFSTFRLRLDDLTDKTLSHQSLNQPLKEMHSEDSAVEKYSPCWPGDWLPLDCPGVRVIAVNYTTDPYLWRPVWVRKRHRTKLRDRAREMTDLLTEHKVGCGHPIIWVGHSKGGLFIKQIIVDAWESGRPAVAPLWKSSKGVFFYSVPHRGSQLADFNLPLLRQSVELTEIQKNCAGLLDLHRRFVALYHSGHLKIDVFSFAETAMTLMSVLYLRIVGVDSTDPGIGEVCGVHLDHREICKPRSRKCILYTELVKMINRVS